MPSQLAALLHGAGVAPLDNTGWIRVTGGDRVRWLNGMVTNSIQSLKPGEGNYNFLLSVQGRIQGDANIFAEPEALLLETAASQVAGMMALLDHYIIMDDVELADISGGASGVSINGPQAATLLAQAGLVVDSIPDLSRQTVTWNSAEITVIRAYGPMVPRYELWAMLRVWPSLARRSRMRGLYCASRRAWSGCASSKGRRSMAWTFATVNYHRRPDRAVRCTSPRAAIWDKRSSNAFVRGEMCIAPSQLFGWRGSCLLLG